MRVMWGGLGGCWKGDVGRVRGVLVGWCGLWGGLGGVGRVMWGGLGEYW